MNRLTFVLLFVSYIIARDSLAHGCDCGCPRFTNVTTPSGQLKGVIQKTWTKKDFHSFRGIPFAEPPIGDLRFKAPVSAKRWEGVKNATTDGAVCPQPNADSVGPSDESCLFLNVYTKQLNGSKPVIVYFHSGAFYLMTGASTWNGPQYLMDKDIVLVTVNYRLDALGFLTTEDGTVTGNNGMKDQVEALRWVQKHISSFGGNPNQVTIAGYIAGSTSTFLHMLSPMSKGLFHGVIAMSGGVTSNWVITKEPQKTAVKLAGLFNCTTTSNEEMVKCLRKVPPKCLTSKYKEMREFVAGPVVVFGPVIEPDLGNGEERFLTDDPVALIKSQQFQQVPVVTGITELEFLDWGQRILLNDTTRDYFNKNFDIIAPTYCGYTDKPASEAQAITDSLKTFYFKNQPISKDSVYELGQLISDYIVIYGEYTTATLLSQYSSKPVFFYKFTYNGNYGHLIDRATNKTLGPVHEDDCMYIFYTSKAFPMLNETDPDAFMVKLETSFWNNFATTGNPTPDDSPVEWAPLLNNDKKYLQIGSVLSMEQGLPFPERMELWSSLFPAA